MAQHFGAGVMWGTPTQDALGSAIAVPTAFQFGIMQNVAFDMSFDEKMLYGSSSFPVDAGRGKGKVDIKAQYANINFLPFSAAFLGVAATNNLITSVNDDVGRAAALTINIVPPGGNTYFANLGVRSDVRGTPYIRVASAPTTGQYTTDGNGNYTFAAADVGKTVFIDYQHMSTTSGKLLTLNSLPMGGNPTFSLDFSMVRNGKVLTLKFPRVISSKLGFSTKQDDFVIPELNMTALQDDTGRVFTWSSTE